MNRGLQVLGTINTLELNNVQTKVTLLNNIENFGSIYRIFINIKDYQDIFYLEKLMFPIAHPSFNRRLIFSAEEREPEQMRRKFGFYRDNGYGYPINMLRFQDSNVLYFGTGPLHDNQVRGWIQNVLRGNPKDYDGYSRLDMHLDEVRYAMIRNKMRTK